MSSGSFTPKGSTEKVCRSDIVAGTIRKIPKGGRYDAGGFIDDTQSMSATA